MSSTNPLPNSPEGRAFARPEAGSEASLEDVLRKSIMDHAQGLLYEAFDRETRTREIYVVDASDEFGLDGVVSILSTRDGILPLPGESKEHMFLYFPLLEWGEWSQIGVYDSFPLIWREHVAAGGKTTKLTIGLDSVAPTALFPVTTAEERARRRWFHLKPREGHRTTDVDKLNSAENLRHLRAQITGFVLTRQGSATDRRRRGA